ncbi:hypothetical protein EV126DRAFT_382744 [Verticillium dahliae]|nr:hypothetical protein EV126DRAFT_382744 [Verticillium dahliae]
MQSAMGIQNGLQQLLMHLQMNESAANYSLSDVVIVSLELAVSRRCRRAIMLDKGYQPVIRELGIASIDTRQIFDQPAECMPASTKRRIKTQQFSTLNASKDFEDCDVTNFGECEFPETLHVLPEELIPIVARAVRIQGDDRVMAETGASTLRQIIVVGHSIAGDLAILKRLGFNMHKEKNIVAILDMYGLSKEILTVASLPAL